MNEWLKFEKNGSIGTLKLNRPDIRNPLGEPEDAENFEEARDLINNDSGNIIPVNYYKEIDNLGMTRDNNCGKLIIKFKNQKQQLIYF